MEQELEREREREQELEQEREQEREQELELEREREQELELEREREQERELEREQEQEQEQELEQERMSYLKIKQVRLKKHDIVWAYLVRTRDGKCLYCGKTEYLNAHHFKGRAIKATRFMLDNGITLCPQHHVFSSEFSAHKTPEKFTRWFKKTFPLRHKAIIKKAQQHMSEREAVKEFEIWTLTQ